jgi:hypothetical protein
MNERRRDVRSSDGIVRRIVALVRPGQSVFVVDLSPSGALIQARKRLIPGARVEIHLNADGQRTVLSALVLRCEVAAMEADLIVYHAALGFEYPSEWVRERQTRYGASLPDPANPWPDDFVYSLPAAPVSPQLYSVFEPK